MISKFMFHIHLSLSLSLSPSIYCLPFGIPPTLPIVVWLGVGCFGFFAGWVWMFVGCHFGVIWRSRVILGRILAGSQAHFPYLGNRSKPKCKK